ncbi:LLM class flavin-dependent oxidoreductase [Streptomyces sp. NPDC047002]|uniref:LLM class flavin-dependent oxidoreductase n=1 Tax=Streptomyces sp. NPDC047002 TaxID=3155475 RepID=UPI0034545D7F
MTTAPATPAEQSARPAAPGTVEFIGMIGTQHASEIHTPSGPAVDRAYTARFARAHEDAGFDRILIGYSSGRPDGVQVAGYVAAHTERIGLLVAHRPGFIAPTLAARTFTTLDQFTGGRVAVHTITGGNDTEQRRDGDYLPKDERYDRTDEYLSILRRAWSSREPFSHEGRHYRFEDYAGGVPPVRESGIPLYFGGSSEAAYRVGARHADTFALWGEPLAETAEQIASVRAAAAAAGRAEPPGISVSFRPILGPTEELAWERAHRILATIKSGTGRAFFDQARRGPQLGEPQNTGSRRLLAAAAKADLHDRALWTPTAAATGAGGNTTALVGTPETVARALLDYVDIGATTLLIRGYDPLDDAIDYGRHLLPLVRQELAHRAATAGSAR